MFLAVIRWGRGRGRGRFSAPLLAVIRSTQGRAIPAHRFHAVISIEVTEPVTEPVRARRARLMLLVIPIIWRLLSNRKLICTMPRKYSKIICSSWKEERNGARLSAVRSDRVSMVPRRSAMTEKTTGEDGAGGWLAEVRCRCRRTGAG
jgi:hypothetical protein